MAVFGHQIVDLEHGLLGLAQAHIEGIVAPHEAAQVAVETIFETLEVLGLHEQADVVLNKFDRHAVGERAHVLGVAAERFGDIVGCVLEGVLVVAAQGQH